MNILETIIAAKRLQVARDKESVPLSTLESSPYFSRSIISMAASLLDPEKTGIIAEFKRRSPSKGIINNKASVTEVTAAYSKYGASGLSILTDHDFFGGSKEDLQAARTNNIPILQKDFIVDEYQLFQARAMGADAILLIAACLSPGEVKQLALAARGFGLEVLLELHSENELDHICDEAGLIGINNRDLRTFKVDLERSLRMAGQVRGDKLLVAESGIDSLDTIRLFREKGFHGFLVGENFMKQEDPGKAFEEFASLLRSGHVASGNK